jgi:hypothetical protein
MTHLVLNAKALRHSVQDFWLTGNINDLYVLRAKHFHANKKALLEIIHQTKYDFPYTDKKIVVTKL